MPWRACVAGSEWGRAARRSARSWRPCGRLFAGFWGRPKRIETRRRTSWTRFRKTRCSRHPEASKSCRKKEYSFIYFMSKDIFYRNVLPSFGHSIMLTSSIRQRSMRGYFSFSVHRLPLKGMSLRCDLATKYFGIFVENVLFMFVCWSYKKLHFKC